MISKQVWVRNGWEKVRAHYDRALEYMPSAQAGIVVEQDDNGTEIAFLISYTTMVAWLDGEGWFGCKGLYSATTRRHISAFAREYGLTFYDFKRACEKGVEINRYTGEEREIG